MKLQNTELKLDKVYENYEPLMNNSLFLNTFIKEYKENESTTYKENDFIVLETKVKNNTYIKSKKLYVDIQNGVPVKLEIKGNSQKSDICINYNSIEIK